MCRAWQFQKRKKFRKALQDALANDPRQPDFLGMTRGGLLELQIAHGEMALDAVMQDQPAQDALAGLRLVTAATGLSTGQAGG